MSTPLQERLEAALAGFRDQQAKLRTFQEEMATRTTTITSKNRMIVATVDATGVLTELAFKGNRYRSLPPAELSAMVVETVAAAQKEAREAAMSAAQSLMPSGGGLTGGLLGGKGLLGEDGNLRDLDSIFKDALETANTPIFDESQEKP